MPNQLICCDDIVSRDGEARRRDPWRRLPANEVQQSGECCRCSLIIGPLRGNAFHELAPRHFSGDRVAQIDRRNGEFARQRTHSVENQQSRDVPSHEKAVEIVVFAQQPLKSRASLFDRGETAADERDVGPIRSHPFAERDLTLVSANGSAR